MQPLPTLDKETSVAKRIKKLLALADGNKNEHERASAMKMAMDLLSKHNLDMAAVKNLSQQSEITEFKGFLKLDPWIRYILSATCKLYYTEMLMRPEYRGRFHDRREYHPTIVGTEENIAVTLEVASWLIHSIRCESNWLFAEAYERRSFRLGAAHRVYERACEMIKEEEGEKNSSSATTGSTALTVLRNELEAANKRYLAGKQLSTFKGKATYSDKTAYEVGSIFGNSVRLGKEGRTRALPLKS